MHYRVFLILLLLFILSFGHTTYPGEKASCWVCDEPYFVMEYQEEQSKNLYYNGDNYIAINGELLPVRVDYHRSSDFAVMPTNSALWDDRLLTGTWKYKGKQLVFSIEEDFIFD